MGDMQVHYTEAMSREKKELSGWGRHSVEGTEIRTEDLEASSQHVPLFRGLGRSYGDSSLPPADQPEAGNTTLADRILAFNPDTGVIRVESGLSLFEMNRLFLPRLWFTPVSPGTQFVTVGGMVASDVHGKNHHTAGSFGDHVSRIRIRVADGRILWCSPTEHEDLFRATIGGMGLTGHILEVEFCMRRIPSRWIMQETQRIRGINEFQDALVGAAPKWSYTMGWIDCISKGRNLGRGIMMCGRWATPEEAPKQEPRSAPRPRLPFDFPQWVLGKLSIRAFNQLYYWKHLSRHQSSVVDPRGFFYPLDMIRDWNRMYGKRGFTQYQCVLPREAGSGSARRLLEVLAERECASFLAVIKDFGEEGRGVLSFPCPGVTIALDIPLRADTQETVDALNRSVIAEGGRIYLTKDSCTRPEDFRAMEPRLEEFQRIRDKWDPERRFRSAQSVRLLGDPA